MSGTPAVPGKLELAALAHHFQLHHVDMCAGGSLASFATLATAADACLHSHVYILVPDVMIRVLPSKDSVQRRPDKLQCSSCFTCPQWEVAASGSTSDRHDVTRGVAG